MELVVCQLGCRVVISKYLIEIVKYCWPVLRLTIVGLYHFATQLLPICCQYMYANFVSVVRGVLCIIMTSPFYCRKYTISQPNYYLFVASIIIPILCSKLEVQYAYHRDVAFMPYPDIY